MAQPVEHPNSAQVRISWFMGLSPASGSGLTARSLEFASDSVSPSSLPLPNLRAHSLSLSQKQIKIKKKIFLIPKGLKVKSEPFLELGRCLFHLMRMLPHESPIWGRVARPDHLTFNALDLYHCSKPQCVKFCFKDANSPHLSFFQNWI